LLERIAAVTKVHPSFFDPELDTRQMLALPMESGGQEAVPAAPTAAATRARVEAEYRQARAFSDAQRGPYANRASYLQSLERMLTLSRALDTRDQDAAILARLGSAQLEDGNLAAARASLTEARELAENDLSDVWGQLRVPAGGRE
jgi:hypothetical protein